MDNSPVLWAFWGHEPLAFYKRRNGNKKTLFGNGEWIDAWYRRLHTEEAIARLADLGVNLIYTHFYKAMGLEFEREEMENTAKIVEIAHRHGIRVLGYATINSVFDESLACEIPDIGSMRIVRANGKESDNYRDYLCLNSRYYAEYYPKVLEYGIRHVGLDGFHIDNAVAPPCRCERCLAGFRQFLEENISDPRSVGLPSFQYVRLPMVPLVRGTDPIALMAVRYYRSLYEKVFGKIYRYVKTLRPDALVLINNGFADEKITPAQLGYEIADDHDSDYIFIETPDRFIGRRENGELKNAVIAWKLAAMAGKKAFNTMWMSFGVEPKTPAAIKRVLFESMVFGSISGTNWAARPVKHGAQMLLDDEMHFSTIRDSFGFYKKHCELYDGTRTLCDVRVLYLPDARLALACPYEKVLHLTADALAANAAVYSFAQLTDAPRPGLVLIPYAEYLSDREVEAIGKLKAAGAKLVFLGTPGIYRENGEEREVKPFESETIIPLPENTPESEAEFQQTVAAAVPRAVRLNRPDILLERAETADGRQVIHLLNPDNENPVSGLEVEIPVEAGDLIEVISPDDPAPEFTAGNGIVRLARLETLVTLVFRGRCEATK
ncbi:MAG: hypothetical protein J5806_04325 [Lentisphaeria bacterium]|nr:hypothetical protein [Lentisphaeria bacterium]